MMRVEAQLENGSGEVVQDAASAPPAPSRRRSSVTKPPTKANNRLEKKKKKSEQIDKIVAAISTKAIKPITPTLIPKSMLAGRPLPLLVCSIGNPGSAYANTLHSAGHTVLNRLADRLGYPGFHKDRNYGNGLLSKSPGSGDRGNWTLWQSTSYMNESGKGVRAAYMAWSKDIPDGEGKLVIVHDELEKPLGAVSVRAAQGASAKGHNGLKSIMSLVGNTPFVRIGVGIGRPVSRTSDDVANYVLKKMSPVEKARIEESVEEVLAKLEQLEQG